MIGDAYLDELRQWPETAVRCGPGLRTAGRVHAGQRTLDERLLELLWRVALRWGEPEARV